MEIKPTYVSFEQAKFLKDKGFDYPCFSWYSFDDKKNRVYTHNYSEYKCECMADTHKEYMYSNHNESFSDGSRWVVERFSRPEQWQVVEWLRVNHGIWILILPQDKSAVDFRIDKSKYPNHALFFSIIKYEEDCSCKELINTSDDKGEVFFHFDSPQEAYSAAFDYILNILI
jgi:hypothetical protein